MGGALRWGILGTGGIARGFIRDLQEEGLAVVAVGSRAQATAEAFGSAFGLARRHGSYEALCADPEVDIVYVATPHPQHHPNALTALRAGKHVLLEKPFTLNAREARELGQEARGRGLFLMEAMWTRFLPTMVALRELVARGELGEVRAVIADHNQQLEKVARLHDPALGGGALLDLGVYPISLAHMLLGMPSEILASAKLTARGVDEDVAMALGWPSGARASLHSGMLAAGPNRAAIIGSRGWVELDRTWYNQTALTLKSPDGAVVRRFNECVKGRGMQQQALEAERCVRAGLVQSQIMSHQGSVEVMEIMDAIRARIGVRYPGE